MNNLQSKLRSIEEKFLELESLIIDPKVIADMPRWQKYQREHAELESIVTAFREYKSTCKSIDDDHEMIANLDSGDEELREFLTSELTMLKEKRDQFEKDLPILLLPKDPNDSRSVIMEIRGGVGGEESALFAGDLFRMYSRYAERKGWKVEILDSNATEIGGFKEISFAVDGDGAFSRLKFESGTHRVQRIPVTESGGRIHTSAVTVAVLPEVEDVEVEINPAEIRIDTYRASGAGGQYVNKTESAIRITHIPTGIVVQCQDEKSQRKNKERAMSVLRARLYDLARQKQSDEISTTRKNQIGSGDRSERIRTYNFPQSRVTDHRIGLTLHKLDSILNGELDELIDALITDDRSKQLSEVS